MNRLLDLQKEILDLNDDDLHVVLLSASMEYRSRIEAKRKKKVCLFYGIRKVRFTGHDSRVTRDAVGHVVKVNKKTVDVDFGSSGGRCRVDASLLEPVVG